MTDPSCADMRLYQHGVVDACMTLHGDSCGTGPILSEHRTDLVQWLRWRLDNWTKPTNSACVDEAVRQLAVSVLREADALLSDVRPTSTAPIDEAPEAL